MDILSNSALVDVINRLRDGDRTLNQVVDELGLDKEQTSGALRELTELLDRDLVSQPQDQADFLAEPKVAAVIDNIKQLSKSFEVTRAGKLTTVSIKTDITDPTQPLRIMLDGQVAELRSLCSNESIEVLVEDIN